MSDLGEISRQRLDNAIELDVLDTGPRDAPAIIFLHGFPESHRTWRHQIRHFRDRYRCVAPDQRGYRGSSKPQEVAAYQVTELVGDVFRLADALGIDRFTVAGHDWGGAVAWAVALNGMANGRVERAIIANAPHPFVFQRLLLTDPEQRAASQYIRAFRDPANDALVEEHGLVALLAKVVRWDQPAALDEIEREALLAGWQDREAARAMLNWYRANPLDVPAPDEQREVPDWLNQELPVLSVPTLVVWGMEDQALPPVNLEGLDELVSDLTVVRVPGSGHFVPWEAPEAVNRAMEEFLAR